MKEKKERDYRNYSMLNCPWWPLENQLRGQSRAHQAEGLPEAPLSGCQANPAASSHPAPPKGGVCSGE